MKKENNNSKKSVKIILLILGAALGVFLLLLGSYMDKEKKSTDGRETTDTLETSMNAEEYAAAAEHRIAELCSGVRGVSDVRVMVTLAGGYNAVYAQNSQSSSSGYRNEFVLTGSGSSEAPLLVGYSVPEISGVGIVCSGGGDANVRREIISLVSATFGVSSNKIYVTEGQN